MPVLTDAAVKKHRGTPKRREVRDGGAQGLHLVIQPNGHKSWALRYRRHNGRPAKLTFALTRWQAQRGAAQCINSTGARSQRHRAGSGSRRKSSGCASGSSTDSGHCSAHADRPP
jgi:hypothetical protein